jgi:tRNA (guanine37-N1)-methyltransferase
MKFTILTLFPDFFPGPFAESIAKKAMDKGLFSIEALNIRDFAEDKHKTVDDTPYGGGAGMVFRPDVVAKSVEAVLAKNPAAKLIYPSPRGKTLNQKKVEELSEAENIVILCGRYEGVDQRVLDHYGFEEISIGDYILSGGEIAAYTIIDACIRIKTGVLGNPQTHKEESFSIAGSEFLLEYPHYTKPAIWQNSEVPEVLLSGNHAKINEWRLGKSEQITKKNRPDLWEKFLNNKTK